MELRATRETLGKTQAQVAKLAEISETQYQNIEYAKCEPGVRTAIRIADSLEITDFEKFKQLFGAATPGNTKEPDGNQAEKDVQA